MVGAVLKGLVGAWACTALVVGGTATPTTPGLVALSVASSDGVAGSEHLRRPARTQAGAERTRREREDAAYPLTSAEIDPDLALEVGGLALVDGPGEDSWERVVIVTRRGEVFAFDGFAGEEPNSKPRVAKVAEGLHEPLGLFPEADGSLVTACRNELVRLVDADGDSRYETSLVVADDWSISGNYHEYNFGPAKSSDGSYWITTNKPFGEQPFGTVDWRGYALRIQPDGDVRPMCAGLRSPAGVGAAPWGEVFYSDNQGEWCGASKLSLLVPGSYHGHPHGINSTDDPAWTFAKPKALREGRTYAEIASSGTNPAFQMPSIWFPYDKMGRSPAEFVWDTTGGKFGPFAGQMFVADQYEAAVFRVDLERVRGHWQGACFRFREGLACGAVRLAFTKGGALIVGQTDRGWGSKGPLTQGVQRIDWSGELPLEIKTLRLRSDGTGFVIRFTDRVDARSIDEEQEPVEIESYTYLATEEYGSPEVDRRAHGVLGVDPHEDGLGMDVLVEGLREGYVHEVRLRGVRGEASGEGVLHPDGFYTLVRLPKAGS